VYTLRSEDLCLVWDFAHDAIDFYRSQRLDVIYTDFPQQLQSLACYLYLL